MCIRITVQSVVCFGLNHKAGSWIEVVLCFCFVLAAQTMNLPSMNQAMNLPTQPLATHCLQLSNMFSPQA